MSENKSFTITGTVEKKEEREGTKGTYFTCKTEHGSINVGQDLIDKTIAEGGTAPRIGQTYTFEGVEYPPKDPKYKTGMRFANSYLPAEKSQVKAAETQKPMAPGVPAQPLLTPQTVGMVINNSVALVVARIQAGTGKSDPVSIKTDIEYWNGYFVEMVQTGKITGVPF